MQTFNESHMISVFGNRTPWTPWDFNQTSQHGEKIQNSQHICFCCWLLLNSKKIYKIILQQVTFDIYANFQ